jgi:hypothetical protein
MRRWSWMICVALVLALAIGCGIATRVMIAKAVLPPHATRLQILVTVLNPPYQMAAPHFNFLKEVRGFFRPTVVHAQVTCGTSPCAYLKPMSYCNPNCTSGGCSCPSCLNLPSDCTPYRCTTSPKLSDICDDTYTDCDGACQNWGSKCTK